MAEDAKCQQQMPPDLSSSETADAQSTRDSGMAVTSNDDTSVKSSGISAYTGPARFYKPSRAITDRLRIGKRALSWLSQRIRSSQDSDSSSVKSCDQAYMNSDYFRGSRTQKSKCATSNSFSDSTWSYNADIRSQDSGRFSGSHSVGFPVRTNTRTRRPQRATDTEHPGQSIWRRPNRDAKLATVKSDEFTEDGSVISGDWRSFLRDSMQQRYHNTSEEGQSSKQITSINYIEDGLDLGPGDPGTRLLHKIHFKEAGSGARSEAPRHRVIPIVGRLGADTPRTAGGTSDYGILSMLWTSCKPRVECYAESHPHGSISLATERTLSPDSRHTVREKPRLHDKGAAKKTPFGYRTRTAGQGSGSLTNYRWRSPLPPAPRKLGSDHQRLYRRYYEDITSSRTPSDRTDDNCDHKAFQNHNESPRLPRGDHCSSASSISVNVHIPS